MNAELAERQVQIAILVAEGLCNKEIAVRLGVAEQTVKNQLFWIYCKLRIDGRVQLARYVFRTGLLAP